MKSILLPIVTVLLLNGSAVVAAETQLRGGSRGLDPDRRILYPDVRVENVTPHTATFTVNYSSYLCSNDNDKSVSPGGLWTGSRGACLITSITASVKTEDNEIVRCSSYSSSGTSYSTFAVMWGGTNSCSVQRTNQSNGIDIINKTKFPLQVSLNQIGPLYWDIIQPGGTFSKDTGSVWFTIQASTYIEGSSNKITTSDSVLPVVAVTASILAAAFTGGTSVLAAAGAGGAGALSTATAGLSSALVGAGLPAGSALLVGGALVGGGKAAIGSSGVTAAAVELIFSEENTSVSKGGAYATSNPRPVWEVRDGLYIKPTECGCKTCVDSIWNTFAGEFKCGDRIQYLQNSLGYNERDACSRVAGTEFRVECGGCDPDRCEDLGQVQELLGSEMTLTKIDI